MNTWKKKQTGIGMNTWKEKQSIRINSKLTTHCLIPFFALCQKTRWTLPTLISNDTDL